MTTSSEMSVSIFSGMARRRGLTFAAHGRTVLRASQRRDFGHLYLFSRKAIIRKYITFEMVGTGPTVSLRLPDLRDIKEWNLRKGTCREVLEGSMYGFEYGDAPLCLPGLDLLSGGPGRDAQGWGRIFGAWPLRDIPAHDLGRRDAPSSDSLRLVS
jgi:hypothetical protein